MTKDKRKDKLRQFFMEMASDPNIISGIHNYCDRWCERCTHTSHCSVYKMENVLDDENSESESLDIINQKFWEQMSEMLQVAAQLLQETMEELEIDPNDLPEIKKEKPDPSKEKAVSIAREYTLEMVDWLKANRDIISNIHEQLINNGGDNAQQIADNFEVIQYYFMIISTKTYRSFLQPTIENENHDALGSAKIALIMIDRSIASWVKLYELLPNYEDDALTFLRKLTVVKKLILEKHPNAMKFKRPGFDD
jgi:hypothetical protein